MSQIQVDHPPLMDFSEYLFQVRKERRLKFLSSLDGPSWNKFHCKSEAINSPKRLRDTLNPLQPGIYLPFLMNEPEPQCPTKKKIFSPNILDHESATFHLHSIQVRLPQGASLRKAYRILFDIFPIHCILLNLISFSFIPQSAFRNLQFKKGAPSKAGSRSAIFRQRQS